VLCLVFLVLGGAPPAARCAIIVRFGRGPTWPIVVRYPGAATVLVALALAVSVVLALAVSVSVALVLGLGLGLAALPRAGRSRAGVTAFGGFDP